MRILLCLAIAWIASPCIVFADAAMPRPNIVFILVDDLGLHDIGVEGSTFYRTPNIDALARGGMRFTAGYAGSRVCSPSRATIQLGQFPARHGITQYIGGRSGMDFNRNEALLSAEYVRELPHGDVTLAEALNEGGYQTFFAGKWHLGGEGSMPTDHGFDTNVGGNHAGHPRRFFAPYQNPQLTDGPAGESLTRRLGRETAEFISSDHEQPYFAMLSFYAVHAPVQTTKELWKKYRDAAPAPPADGNRFMVDRTLPVRQVQDHPVYAGMMETLDDAVGEVLRAVDASAAAENTIVIFTSDNGGVSSGDAYSTSNLPLRGGKGRQWEGGVREPLYVRYPAKVKPGSTCDVPVTGADFYPTLLDLTGLALRPNQHLDGRSMAKLLTDGEDDSWTDRPLIWHYPHYDNQGGEPSSLIRIGDFKLIHYHLDRHDELYNLRQDPSEQNDLAAADPDKVASLRASLLGYLNQVGAVFPEPDPRFDPAKYEAMQEMRRGSLKAQLEKNQAQMLEPNYRPNPNWWGSSVD